MDLLFQVRREIFYPVVYLQQYIVPGIQGMNSEYQFPIFFDHKVLRFQGMPEPLYQGQ